MRNFLMVILAAAPFGASAQSWTAPACEVGRPGDHYAGLDDDGDAIPDSEDWCEGTKPGTRVGPNGCADWEVPVDCGTPPAPEGEAAAKTPDAAMAAAPVADTDGDGVNDAADKCGGTPAGLDVDAKGCVLIEKVVLKGVNFAMGSAQLLPEASTTLRTIALAMKASPTVEVEVGGHTDSVGPADKNQRLSERRAKSVKDFLVGEGVEAARLSVKGYGESAPADSNQTTAGQANNRRVAFRITKQ